MFDMIAFFNKFASMPLLPYFMAVLVVGSLVNFVLLLFNRGCYKK